MSTTILEYVREKKTRHPIGVVVAVSGKNNKVKFGWSLCMVSPSKRMRERGVTPDIFSKEDGIMKATCKAKGCGLSADDIMKPGSDTDYHDFRPPVRGSKRGNGQATYKFYTIPHDCREALRRLKKRAKRYFKEDESLKMKKKDKKKKDKKAKDKVNV